MARAPGLMCSRQTCQYPLPNHRALELGKDPHHLDGSPAGGRGIQPLVVQAKVNLL
jgi:hypothetical protein